MKPINKEIDCELSRIIKSGISNIVAPKIIGIAKKNENLNASLRLMPKKRALVIVIPEREIPGNIENACINPIIKTDLIQNEFCLCSMNFDRNKIIPVIIKKILV